MKKILWAVLACMLLSCGALADVVREMDPGEMEKSLEGKTVSIVSPGVGAVLAGNASDWIKVRLGFAGEEAAPAKRVNWQLLEEDGGDPVREGSLEEVKGGVTEIIVPLSAFPGPGDYWFTVSAEEDRLFLPFTLIMLEDLAESRAATPDEAQRSDPGAEEEDDVESLIVEWEYEPVESNAKLDSVDAMIMQIAVPMMNVFVEKHMDEVVEVLRSKELVRYPDKKSDTLYSGYLWIKGTDSEDTSPSAAVKGMIHAAALATKEGENAQILSPELLEEYTKANGEKQLARRLLSFSEVQDTGKADFWWHIVTVANTDGTPFHNTLYLLCHFQDRESGLLTQWNCTDQDVVDAVLSVISSQADLKEINEQAYLWLSGRHGIPNGGEVTEIRRAEATEAPAAPETPAGPAQVPESVTASGQEETADTPPEEVMEEGTVPRTPLSREEIEKRYSVRPVEEGSYFYVRINRDRGCNVRSGPSQDSLKVGTTLSDRRYPVLGFADNGWYLIELPDGTIGFVAPNLARLFVGSRKY